MRKKTPDPIGNLERAVKSESTVASLIAKLSKLNPYAFISFDVVYNDEVFTSDELPKLYATEMGNVRLEFDAKNLTYIFSKDHKTLDRYLTIGHKIEIVKEDENA
jgi:hypothetical protein